MENESVRWDEDEDTAVDALPIRDFEDVPTRPLRTMRHDAAVVASRKDRERGMVLVLDALGHRVRIETGAWIGVIEDGGATVDLVFLWDPVRPMTWLVMGELWRLKSFCR
jgi:hypothetical protein